MHLQLMRKLHGHKLFEFTLRNRLRLLVFIDI